MVASNHRIPGAEAAVGTHIDLVSGAKTPNFGFEGVQGSFDIKDMVSKGIIPDHQVVFEFGQRNSLTSAPEGEDIWNGVASVIPRPPDAGELMSITCEDAADDVAGTGVRSVEINYIDAAGDHQTLIVETNGGTTNIPTVMFRYINGFHGRTWGTDGVAAGHISIHSTATPATIYSQIDAFGNFAPTGNYMVPIGHQLFISNVSVTATGNKSVLIQLRATSSYTGELLEHFIFKRGWELLDAAIAESLSPQLVMPALSVIKASATSVQAGGRCTINWSGWVEPT